MKLIYVPIRAQESQSDPTLALKKTGIKNNDEITIDNVKKLISVTFFIVIDDYILLEQQLIQSGEHEVLPYIHIIQDGIPDELFESIGIQNAAIIGESYLKMPIEIMKETLLIQQNLNYRK